MLLLSVILLLAAILTLAYAGIWSIVQAFCRHVLWGVAYIFVPFASLAFLIIHWSDARRPFFLSLAGGAVFVGALFMLPKNELQKYLDDSPRLTSALIGAVIALGHETSKSPRVEPAHEEKKSYDEQMAALHAREQDILARKSRLQPGDHAAAEALNREIAEYNAAREGLVAAEEKGRESASPAQTSKLAGARP